MFFKYCSDGIFTPFVFLIWTLLANIGSFRGVQRGKLTDFLSELLVSKVIDLWEEYSKDLIYVVLNTDIKYPKVNIIFEFTMRMSWWFSKTISFWIYIFKIHFHNSYNMDECPTKFHIDSKHSSLTYVGNKSFGTKIK